MKPWDIHTHGKKPDDAFTLPLWAPFGPDAFYFATTFMDGVAVIYIVPVDYWNLNARTFHDSMPIVHHLPNYLEEIFEGAYEAEKGIQLSEVSRDLLRKGFTHNHFFQRYIDQNKVGVRGF